MSGEKLFEIVHLVAAVGIGAWFLRDRKAIVQGMMDAEGTTATYKRRMGNGFCYVLGFAFLGASIIIFLKVAFGIKLGW